MGVSDFFLKLDGIKGESQDSLHAGEIDIESFQWGLDQTLAIGSASAGIGAGKAHPSGAVFTARVSAASPLLLVACAAGTVFMNALLTVRKAGGKQEDYLKIKFSTAGLSSYRCIGSSENPVPKDEFMLSFGMCQFEYGQQTKEGGLGPPVLGGWDFIKNKKA